MKQLYFLTALFNIFIVCHAQNQYYWSGGQKIGWDTDSSRMVVRFDVSRAVSSSMAHSK